MHDDDVDQHRFAATASGPERRELIRRQSEVRAQRRQQSSMAEIGNESLQRALGGGVTGAVAMVFQVSTLMWMRTTVAYQYRYGSTTREALRALYSQGGALRFYQGVLPALLQAPLSRFGDTAANAGMVSALNACDSTRDLPTPVKTLASASAATCWRVMLMPLDTLKLMMQVEGANGATKLRAKLAVGGLPVLFHGASGLVTSAFLGHYFWYGTYNMLDARCPRYDDLWSTLARNAGVGFFASAVADTTTNSVRVLKTFRQTSETPISYSDAARDIMAKDGLRGLLGRGLVTRLFSNGVQAALFSATWKLLEARWNGPEKSTSQPQPRARYPPRKMSTECEVS